MFGVGDAYGGLIDVVVSGSIFGLFFLFSFWLCFLLLFGGFSGSLGGPWEVCADEGKLRLADRRGLRVGSTSWWGMLFFETNFW